VERLGKAGIKLEDSYVLELSGETEETPGETFRVAEKLASLCQVEDTAFGVMTPLLGSPDWNRMMKIPELREKYRIGYHFDIDEMRQDFFKYFCKFDS